VTTATMTPAQQGTQAGYADFGQLLRAEWIKFRTVRGWIIAIVVVPLAAPLSPRAGFAVLCGYAVLALAVAWCLLRRRDA
jgi:hypothetical protein